MKNSPKKSFLLLQLTLAICLTSWSLAQEKSVSLTVYNDNLALVREVRSMEITQGASRIEFKDVAAQIDPTSVYFNSLTAPDQVTILEQNYEYDLVNSTKILQKYIDQSITVSSKDGAVYSGTLLSDSGSDYILRQSDGHIKVVSRDIVETLDFPELPEGLITRPTLVWHLDNRRGGAHKIEVGYLTSGIEWHAEYVGVSNKDDTRLDLGGWVSIDNRSGATYENARLKVVAGQIHRARPPVVPRLSKAVEMAVVPDQFEEKAFFEYHLYTLLRAATVANNQVKQISLFPNTEVKVVKKYSYDGARDAKRVRVNLEFDNSKQAGLGMPLPEGKIRVYKQDDDQSLVLVGEDRIDHTPKDEEVRVYVGNAFDIVGERKQKERRSIGRTSHEETWEIVLRNHKQEAVEITVIERFGLNWEILKSSHDYTKKDANTIEFLVKIPKDGEVVIEYLVRYNR